MTGIHARNAHQARRCSRPWPYSSLSLPIFPEKPDSADESFSDSRSSACHSSQSLPFRLILLVFYEHFTDHDSINTPGLRAHLAFGLTRRINVAFVSVFASCTAFGPFQGFCSFSFQIHLTPSFQSKGFRSQHSTHWARTGVPMRALIRPSVACSCSLELRR